MAKLTKRPNCLVRTDRLNLIREKLSFFYNDPCIIYLEKFCLSLKVAGTWRDATPTSLAPDGVLHLITELDGLASKRNH